MTLDLENLKAIELDGLGWFDTATWYVKSHPCLYPLIKDYFISRKVNEDN